MPLSTSPNLRYDVRRKSFNAIASTLWSLTHGFNNPSEGCAAKFKRPAPAMAKVDLVGPIIPRIFAELHGVFALCWDNLQGFWQQNPGVYVLW